MIGWIGLAIALVGMVLTGAGETRIPRRDYVVIGGVGIAFIGLVLMGMGYVAS